MSTFAVFGMTESFARDEAEEKVSPYKLDKALTLEEYGAALNEYVKHLMKGKRQARVSRLFDSPEFARDFIEIIKKSGVPHRDLRIRAQIRVESHSDSKRPYKTKWVDSW